MEILCFFDNSGLHLCYQASQRLTSEAVIPRAMLACTKPVRADKRSRKTERSTP